MREATFEANRLFRERGSAAAAMETFLGRQPGIHHAVANVMSDSVTIGYDEATVAEPQVRRLIERCGYHCRGEVVPAHLTAPDGQAAHHAPMTDDAPTGAQPIGAGDGHDPSAHAGPSGEAAQIAHEMGHGAGVTMETMVRDMRNRFWVTFALAIAVTLFSPLAGGIRLSAPFGLSENLVMFLLSTPAVLWGGQTFFVGAARALRTRTLDMSVLVALSVGAGYVFSIVTTFFIAGESFYEAVVVLLAFILFGGRFLTSQKGCRTVFRWRQQAELRAKWTTAAARRGVFPQANAHDTPTVQGKNVSEKG